MWAFAGGVLSESSLLWRNGTPDFDLTVYFPVLEKEVRAFGLHVTIQEKEKTKESNIRSAFLKGNTKEHLLLFYADENLARSVAGSITVAYTQYHKRWENICPKKKLSRPCTNSLHYGKIAVQIQCYR